MYPGRWNPSGIPVIYAAQTSSLCALEILAGAKLAADYVVVEIEIPDNVRVELLQDEDLPSDWNAEIIPNRRELSAAAGSLAAVLPYYPFPQLNRYERNFVLNPGIRIFQRFSFGEPEPFAFPIRLRRRI